jgi:hypothetical protein
MAEAQFIIKFDGGDAAEHAVDMRLLGRSLVGFDRIISDGLILITEGRLPGKGERYPLRAKAREPVIGSSGIPVDLTTAAGLLPLGWWLLQTGATEVISKWVSFVLAWFGGRKGDAEAYMDALVKMREIEANERLEAQRMWHQEGAAFRALAYELLRRQSNPAKEAVSAVGRSVDSVSLIPSNDIEAKPAVTVDVPMADAIRQEGELEISDMVRLELRVDGFVHHSRKLNVENPEEPGSFISADVRDPAFEQTPNVYTEAASSKSAIDVEAKIARRAGQIERIYILNCVGRAEAA